MAGLLTIGRLLFCAPARELSQRATPATQPKAHTIVQSLRVVVCLIMGESSKGDLGSFGTSTNPCQFGAAYWGPKTSYERCRSLFRRAVRACTGSAGPFGRVLYTGCSGLSLQKCETQSCGRMQALRLVEWRTQRGFRCVENFKHPRWFFSWIHKSTPKQKRGPTRHPSA